MNCCRKGPQASIQFLDEERRRRADMVILPERDNGPILVHMLCNLGIQPLRNPRQIAPTCGSQGPFRCNPDARFVWRLEIQYAACQGWGRARSIYHGISNAVVALCMHVRSDCYSGPLPTSKQRQRAVV